MTGLTLHAGGKRIERQNLKDLDTPVSTSASHVILPHHMLVDRVLESLEYRKINVLKDEYAIGRDGARLFGMMTLDIQQDGISLVMGLRNSHDKSFSLGIVAGFRVFVCDNLAFSGDFQPLAKKHSKHLMSALPDAISIGIDRTQRQFQPIMQNVNRWKDFDLSDSAARSVIYDAFILGQLDAPERLASDVHEMYFNPPHDEFKARNMWSMHNAFTEAFKKLDPMPQYKALASLDDYLKLDNKDKTVHDKDKLVEAIVAEYKILNDDVPEDVTDSD